MRVGGYISCKCCRTRQNKEEKCELGLRGRKLKKNPSCMLKTRERETKRTCARHGLARERAMNRGRVQ